MASGASETGVEREVVDGDEVEVVDGDEDDVDGVVVVAEGFLGVRRGFAMVILGYGASTRRSWEELSCAG